MLTQVHDTLLDSVRMGFLHASRTRGRIPSMLQRAAEIHYTGHSSGPSDSTLLHFEAPEFGDVASDLFRQGQLWDAGPKPDQTAFDLLAESLRDVRHFEKDSVRFDHALLNRFARYRHVLRRGLTEIALPDAKISEVQSIDAALSDAAQTLYRETPPSRRVRISGRLDLLGVSKKVLGIVLDNNVPVTCVWTTEGFVDLAPFLDKVVAVEGMAQFRPSGSLLRVDADAIREAGVSDAAFSVLPLAERKRNYQTDSASVKPGQKPYDVIFGMVPGEESDEDFVAAVEAFN